MALTCSCFCLIAAPRTGAHVENQTAAAGFFAAMSGANGEEPGDAAPPEAAAAEDAAARKPSKKLTLLPNWEPFTKWGPAKFKKSKWLGVSVTGAVLTSVTANELQR